MDYDLSVKNSEIVIGVTAAIGTDLNLAIQNIKSQLNKLGYESKEIKISEEISELCKIKDPRDFFSAINQKMNAGNEYREKSGCKEFWATAAINKIAKIRSKPSTSSRTAYIVSSFKTPEEVLLFRKVYPQGFFLFGIHASDKDRRDNLVIQKGLSNDQAQQLMDRDLDESNPYGQKTTDTFHLSDFFINSAGVPNRISKDIERFLALLFGHPYITPTFDEYAMFMAFSSSIRSGDLSRQVGAVLAQNDTIVSTGANEVPRFKGGQYWPKRPEPNEGIADEPGSRDFVLKIDSNIKEQKEIAADISNKIIEKLHELNYDIKPEDYETITSTVRKSRLKNITEFGRIVHAEMEAILSCARSNNSTAGTTLYCTTFPCHNCAKHIISAGIKETVYIEPYQKSKALQFHKDAITTNHKEKSGKVLFRHFIGVGPRAFWNLFSINLSSGYKIERKDSSTGEVFDWEAKEDRELRIPLMTDNYFDREVKIVKSFELMKKKIKKGR